MIALFTGANFTPTEDGFTQSIAHSNDCGRTWKKYKNNPVLEKLTKYNRDPKVIWYAPESKWIMALYLDRIARNPPPTSDPVELAKLYKDKNTFGLFSSPDLKRWTKMSEIRLNDGECAEFFEIAVDGNSENKRWIFYGAGGQYLIGSFDGKTFNPESGPHSMQYGNCFYASQTVNDIPDADGRRILIPWGRTRADMGGRDGQVYKGMPFNQMMGNPVVLTLRKTEQGLRLFSNPVQELKSLRHTAQIVKPQRIRAGDNPLAGIAGELFDIESEISLDDADIISFNLRGIPVTYDVRKQQLSCEGKSAPLIMLGGRIKLRMLVDRTSIDIFGNDGALYKPMGMVVPGNNHSLALTVNGGQARVEATTVFELKSAWE